MKFEIKRARNGWTLEAIDDDDTTEMIVGEETGACEFENFRRFIEEIIQVYGPSDSRYSDKRLSVHLLPGDKHEGPIENSQMVQLIGLCAGLLRTIHLESCRRKRMKGQAIPDQEYENTKLLLSLAETYYLELNKMVN